MTGWSRAVLLVLGLCACRNDDGKLQVTAIDPRVGEAAGGQTVEISGHGFQTVTRGVQVYFGDRPGAVLRIGNDKITVRAPGGKVGAVVDVVVMFEPGGALSVPKAFSFVEKVNVDVKDLGRANRPVDR